MLKHPSPREIPNPNVPFLLTQRDTSIPTTTFPPLELPEINLID